MLGNMWGIIQNHTGKTLTIRIHNADNALIVFLDDELLVNKETGGDPTFQEDHTKVLSQGHHRLIVGGLNWGGPAHFRYSIILDDHVRDSVDIRPGDPTGLVYHRIYLIGTW
jgi:hypothetical protein